MPERRDVFTATGKRKSAVARVRMHSGEGRIVVNQRALEDYFGRETSRMIVNQPFDVTNTRGKTTDISALGVDRSSLGPIFATAARAEKLTATSEPDTRGSFFRSDHFPFVRAGVPALSLKPGLAFVGRPAGWGKEQEDRYNEKRYHQPADEYSKDFNYEGMVQQVRVALRVALAVANTGVLPDWLPSAEFKRPR